MFEKLRDSIFLSKSPGDQFERGTTFVYDRIQSATKRLTVLAAEKRLHDIDAIWETYYQIEEAVLVAKVLFKGFDRPGKFRKLPEFQALSDSVVRAAIKIAEENLLLAETNLVSRHGPETIEFLRKARDQMKALVIVGDKSARRKTVEGSKP